MYKEIDIKSYHVLISFLKKAKLLQGQLISLYRQLYQIHKEGD